MLYRPCRGRSKGRGCFALVSRRYSTLIKKKIKFSSIIRNFRMEQLQSYMTNGLLIHGEILAHFLIY